MKCLAKKVKMPPHELVPIALESGTKNGGVDEFHPGKTVNVPRWDFQKVVISYLLDPILFGNQDNLVSRDNPWEKFEIANPKESKEYLGSNHYSQSFDECMDNVDDGCVWEQFFFPIEIYVDKSGKTAGQTSSCGEPVLMSTPLLTSSKHEEPSSWMLLSYIPDLEKTSSAKKQQESQRKFEKGRNQCNYHKCLWEVLQPVVQSMEQHFNAHVCQGDEIAYKEVLPCLTFVSGEGKNGDNLVLRYGGKNCKGRVPRLCMTPLILRKLPLPRSNRNHRGSLKREGTNVTTTSAFGRCCSQLCNQWSNTSMRTFAREMRLHTKKFYLVSPLSAVMVRMETTWCYDMVARIARGEFLSCV
jgi:hypothetical protein